jgi:hypothetical protein
VRTWVFRGLLLLTVMGSLAVRFEGLRNHDELATFNVDSAIREVILDRGFVLRENPVQPPKVLSRAVYFQRPECSRASLVMPYALTSEVLLILTQTIESGFERRYFYLDKSWDAPNRFAMYFEWGKNVFLGRFRNPRYFDAETAIVVAEPVDCNRSVSVDWQLVWDRNRHRVGTRQASRLRELGDR